jgi:hypothetical protein
MPPSAVVIGASDLLDALKASAGVSEALAFPDSQPLQALQAIAEERPPLVVLERLFAATSRGAALINRIKSDPSLGHTEIRVMSHTGDYSRVISRPSAPGASESGTPAPATGGDGASAAAVADVVVAPLTPAAGAPRPLDWRGTRRASRHRARSGVEIQVDGNTALLIDVSQIGAQVLSAASLRPNQRVRVTLSQEDGSIRVRASVAWAKFELPGSGGAPQYRAGLEFIEADPGALDAYCERVKLS